MMEEAKTLRIISKAGTDLKVDKTGRQAHCQCSLANVPGRWDNADYGRVDCGPPYTIAEGTIVFDCGDYILQMDRIVTLR
jgi:leucyl aminopeptidase (aminopeptidase T)